MSDPPLPEHLSSVGKRATEEMLEELLARVITTESQGEFPPDLYVSMEADLTSSDEGEEAGEPAAEEQVPSERPIRRARIAAGKRPASAMKGTLEPPKEKKKTKKREYNPPPSDTSTDSDPSNPQLKKRGRAESSEPTGGERTVPTPPSSPPRAEATKLSGAEKPPNPQSTSTGVPPIGFPLVKEVTGRRRTFK